MRPLVTALLPILLCCGCSNDAASPTRQTPGDTTWTAPHFEEYFEELAIQDAGTGQRGMLELESGYRFSRKARLELAYVAHRPSTLRLVVQSRASGELAGAWSHVVADSGAVPLGVFARDLYMLHAFILGARIAAIPFASE